MKKKKIRTLYNRALSMALVVSTTASLCLGVSGVTAAMEEQRRAEEATEEVVSGERHHHTFACYEEYELDCTENHSENEHRKSCYRYSGERICGLEDGDLHLHGPECEVVAKVLICGEDEDASGEILNEEDDKTTEKTADNEGAGESTADDGSVGGGIADDGIEGGEVTDGGAEGDEVAGDGIDGDEIAGDEIAGGETAGDEIAGDEIGGGEISGDEIAGDDIAGDETNNGEDNTAGNTGEETDGSDSVESSKEAADGSDGAGEETLESGSAGKETAGSADAGKETAGSADAGKETAGSADAGKETAGSVDAGKETTGSVDAEGSKEETNASGNAGEESSSGSNDKETVDIENAGKETAASDSAGKETAGSEGAGKETAGAEGAGKESAGSENAGGGNSGSGEWNNGGETSSGEKTNISAAKSGRDRFSLLAVNQHSYGSVLFPQLYIGSPINALLDKILPEEELLAGEDGTGNVTDNEIDNESETVNDETEKTEDADNGKGHQHSEECYKIIYQCRAGVATMALREGGVTNEEDLRRAITNSSGATTISIVGNEEGKFVITSPIIVESEKNITIDLQGYTIIYNGTNAADSMFKVNGGTLTIRDSANAQQGAKKISEEIVSEAEEASYDETTGRLTYYVTECSVNLDGKSTTNTVKKYVYDLGTNKISKMGGLKANGIESIIYVDGGTLNLYGGYITNLKGKHGISTGTQWNDITIHGGYIVNCGNKDSIGNGGGIFLQAGALNIKDGVIAFNEGQQGGGIYGGQWTVSDGQEIQVTIEGGIFAENQSKLNGGGIYGVNITLGISGNPVFAKNTAQEDGGGIFLINKKGKMNIAGGTIVGNTARSGGGIYSNDCVETNELKGNIIISKNTARESGGGIYFGNGNVSIGNLNTQGEKIIVSDNSASGSGGGICFLDTTSITGTPANIIVAANKLNNNKSDNIYPLDKIGSSKDNNCYIEWVLQSGSEIKIDSYDRLKDEIEATQNSTKVIQLAESINMENAIEVNNNANIVLILDGNDISGQNVTDNYLFSVSGKGSSLTIRNKPLNENESIIKEEKPVSLNDIGEPGKFDKENNKLTYYVTKSNVDPSNNTKTIETTFESNIYLKSAENRVGTIEGNGKTAVLYGNNEGSLIIEGGIITGAKHGIKLENKAAMVMQGGYIVGCGSEVSSVDNTTTGDDGNSPENGAGIYANGAAGIQIFDGVIAGNTTPKRGGGIFSNAGIVEIKGGIIAANIAGNIGGGICAQGTAVTTIGNPIKNETEAIPSLVISGNTAKAQELPTDKRGTENFGGGGIFSGFDAKLFILQNAYITNNRADRIPKVGTDGIRDGGELGGGGVFSCGKVEMSGSFVTANYSAASGGGIFSYSGNENKDASTSDESYTGKITLTGGIIAGNYAEHSEGGGLRINWRGEIKSAEGNKIYITNNRTDTTTNWGGGGIFNTSSAQTTIQNVLITDNTAEGFGGGVSGCNHGTNQFFVANGAGIFENKAKGTSEKLKKGTFPDNAKNEQKNFADCIDARTPVIQEGEAEIGKHPLFIDFNHGDSVPSYQDFYCSNISQVYGTMLGGGSAEWRGSGSSSAKDNKNPTAFPVEIVKDDFVETSNLMGLTAHPSEGDKNKAKAAAEIYITGNYSAAHGAGVMTNGTFKIGVTEKHQAGLTIEKQLQDIHGASISDESKQEFKFKIRLMNAENELLEGKHSYKKSPVDTTLDKDKGEGEISITKDKPAEVTLRAGQKLTISGLPNGSYQITEMEDINSPYEVKDGENIKEGVVWAEDGRTVLFVNIPKASLRIKKILEDDSEEGADNRLFAFTIHLTDAAGQNISGQYSYIKEPFSQTVDGGTKEGKITFTNGESEKVYLRHGQNISLYNLPDGANYRITEWPDEKYEAKDGKYEQSGVIKNQSVATVTFTNARKSDEPKPEEPENKYASLLIKKELQDSEGNKIDNNHHLFTFALRLKDSDKKDITGEYSFTKTPFDSAVDKEGPVGVLKFEENKAAMISLRGGQSIRIEKLPAGSCHVIESEDAKYKVKDGKYEQSAEILAGEEAQITFVNVSEGETTTESPENPKPPKDPEDPDEPESPKDPENPDKPEPPKDPDKPDETETTKNPENTTSTDEPTPSTTAPSPGGGGRHHDNPTTAPQPTTIPPTETLPVTNTDPGTESSPALETPSDPGAGSPGSDVPQYLTELPDPNAPGSPDSVTIMEDDVPRTYIKVWNPETEEFVYLPEDEVPLSSMLPKTGDPFKRDLWRMMFILSLISTAVLLCLKKIENRREREE